MMSFKGLEILGHFLGPNMSAAVSLEMLRAGLFEQQLKLASQPDNSPSDKKNSLPMIKKTLPIGPPIPAPPSELEHNPSEGKDQTARSARLDGNSEAAPANDPSQPEHTPKSPPEHPEEEKQKNHQPPSSLPTGTQELSNQAEEPAGASGDQQEVAQPGESLCLQNAIPGGPPEEPDPDNPLATEPLPALHETSEPVKKEEEAPSGNSTDSAGQLSMPLSAQAGMAPESGAASAEASLGTNANSLPASGSPNPKPPSQIETAPIGSQQSAHPIFSEVLPPADGQAGELSGELQETISRNSAEQKGSDGQINLTTGGSPLARVSADSPTIQVAGTPITILPTVKGFPTEASGKSESGGQASESVQGVRNEGANNGTVASKATGHLSLDASSGRAGPFSNRTAPNQGPEGSSQQGQVERVRFIQRVARAFQALRQGGGTVRLRLHPPELGSLRMELLVREGVLRARLEVENSAARSVILEHLPMLRERLAQQDIRIEQFDVEIGNEFSGSYSQQSGSAASEHRGYEFSGPTDRYRRPEAFPPPAKENVGGILEGSKIDIII